MSHLALARKWRPQRFEDVVAGIERALVYPQERQFERERVAREVVGEMDGLAAERVVDAIVHVLGGRSAGERRPALSLAEQGPEPEEDESGGNGQEEVEVGEEPEGVQGDDRQGRER